jgi:hypothetical protein
MYIFVKKHGVGTTEISHCSGLACTRPEVIQNPKCLACKSDLIRGGAFINHVSLISPATTLKNEKQVICLVSLS